uniref:Aminotransferase-like plant mobile domain-containing protein n=1 Tax=Populus alba TaxID=43335 RepID=A0A4U5PT29_POPAL|nr:hypothetical protein D5086_0000186260 [Populus alba]
MQSVQVWVWKRFNELQPKPNLMKSGYPRLARWDKLKQKVENVSLNLDSAKESFSSGKLGFPQCGGSSLNEDLMAFARRVGVSMQFGSDEDLSGQCSNRPEVAWAAAYCRGHFTPPQLTCDHPTRSLLGAVCQAEPKAEVNYK